MTETPSLLFGTINASGQVILDGASSAVPLDPGGHSLANNDRVVVARQGAQLVVLALFGRVDTNPVGTILEYAGASAPTGYLLCDGSAVSRTAYAALYTLIGTTYGAGDGSTTFNLPDRRGRVGVGVGTATGAAGATNHTLAQAAGEETHVLTQAEMPSHTHTQNPHSHTTKINTALVNTRTAGTATDNVDSQGADPTSSVTAVNQNTGGGAAHNNMQPYLALNYVIKV